MKKINDKEFLIHLIREHASHYFDATKELRNDIEVIETLLIKEASWFSYLTFKQKNNKKIFDLAIKIANKIENVQDKDITINSIICNNTNALYNKLKQDYDNRDNYKIEDGVKSCQGFEPLDDFAYIKTCFPKIYNNKRYKKDFLNCKDIL